MGWDQVHRRYELVQQTADAVARYGPGAVDDWRPAIDKEYGGVDGWLRDVQRRWYSTVDAQLDAVLEAAPYDLADAIAELWRDATRARPELHAVLAAYAGHPALAAGRERHRRTLFAATGVDEARLGRAAAALAAA